MQAGLAGLAAIISVPAAAQVTQLPPIISSPGPVTPPTGVSADPYRVFGDDAPVFAALGVLGGIGMDISASLSTEYSDNIARVGEGEDISARYRSKDDWIFRPGVNFGFNKPVGRQKLFFGAGLGRNIYARNTSLNSNRLSLTGGAALSLGTRCGGEVKGGYSNRGTQLGAFEEVIPSTQIRVSFGANASCRTPGGLTGSVGYSYSKSTNETHDPLGEVDRSFADVNSNSVSGSLGYALGARGQVGIQGAWNNNKYPNQLLPTGGSNENEVVSGSLFASYRVGSSISASASIGKSEVRTNVPGTSPFSGGTWNLGVNYSGPRIGASLSTGRSVNGGSGGSANYSIGTFFNASTSYRLNDRASASAGFASSNSDYSGYDALPETEELRSSKSRRFFIGADYRMTRIFSFSLDLNHQKRSSDPDGFNYDENSVILGIRAKF